MTHENFDTYTSPHCILNLGTKEAVFIKRVMEEKNGQWGEYIGYSAGVQRKKRHAPNKPGTLLPMKECEF